MKGKTVFPKTTLKKVDVLAADGAFNVGCYTLNGKLIPAINTMKKISEYDGKVRAAWYSAEKKKHVVKIGDSVYYSDGSVQNAPNGPLTAEFPSMIETVVNGESAAVVIGDGSYYFIGSTAGAKPYKSASHGCVIKNGRIFAIDNANPYKIVWSGEGGIDDWEGGISGAGWAVLHNGYGRILNLVVYADKIIAVREKGLTVITAYGNPENFKVSHIEQKLPEIYKNTSAVVGNKLVFYTKNGLYSFNGAGAEKLFLPLAEEMRTAVTAAVMNETYYLIGESKTLQERTVLAFDSRLNVAYIIFHELDALSVGERLLGYLDTREYELEAGGTYAYTSGEIDFSSSGAKVLKEVVLRGAKDARLEVSNGVNSRIVEGVRGKFRPNMRGESFKITVYGKEKIDGISAVAEVLSGV